jgi:hypothetical protein
LNHEPQAEQNRPFRAPIAHAPWWWLSTLLILALIALVFHNRSPQHWLGFGDLPLWVDSHAILSALDAHRAGLDVFKSNPYDLLSRPHSYSSLWLQLEHLGLTRWDQVPFGFACELCFLVPAVFLFRPSTLREALWIMGFFLCAPVLLAVDRANNDLVIFGLLCPVVPCLLSRSLVVRLVAPLLISLAAGLKYYPLIAACVLFIDPDRKSLRLLTAVFLASAALVLYLVFNDLAKITATQPRPEGMLSMGGGILLQNLGIPKALTTPLSLLMGAGVATLAWCSPRLSEWSRAAATQWRYASFILSSSLLAGCFWTGSNWAYRTVFVIGMIPLLVAPVEVELMPGFLRRSLPWLRAALILIFVPHTLGGAINWAAGSEMHPPVNSIVWELLWNALQYCYLLLSVAGTLLVSNLVFMRVREQFRPLRDNM